MKLSKNILIPFSYKIAFIGFHIICYIFFVKKNYILTTLSLLPSLKIFLQGIFDFRGWTWNCSISRIVESCLKFTLMLVYFTQFSPSTLRLCAEYHFNTKNFSIFTRQLSQETNNSWWLALIRIPYVHPHPILTFENYILLIERDTILWIREK